MENLDCLPQSELMEFWQTHQGGRKYRLIFPDGGTGTMRAVADLANYAANKATAMACRERGQIQTAMQYESICDSIYAGLPDDCKW
jgi:hypothetical protein